MQSQPSFDVAASRLEQAAAKLQESVDPIAAAQHERSEQRLFDAQLQVEALMTTAALVNRLQYSFHEMAPAEENGAEGIATPATGQLGGLKRAGSSVRSAMKSPLRRWSSAAAIERVEHAATPERVGSTGARKEAERERTEREAMTLSDSLQATARHANARGETWRAASLFRHAFATRPRVSTLLSLANMQLKLDEVHFAEEVYRRVLAAGGEGDDEYAEGEAGGAAQRRDTVREETRSERRHGQRTRHGQRRGTVRGRDTVRVEARSERRKRHGQRGGDTVSEETRSGRLHKHGVARSCAPAQSSRRRRCRCRARRRRWRRAR